VGETGVHGTIILTEILREEVEGCGLDMGQWRTVVNTVMDFQVPQKAGNLLTI